MPKQVRALSAALVFIAVLNFSRAQAATAINKCGTAIAKSGSYVVKKNLTVKSGSTAACIAVSASYVSIDLAGFTIDCAGQQVIGIDLTADAGVVVRNGMITRCKIGLAVSNVSLTGVLVDGVSTIANIGGGMSLEGGATVTASVSNNNGIGGIFVACPANVLDTIALGNLASPNISPLGSGCNLFNDLAP